MEEQLSMNLLLYSFTMVLGLVSVLCSFQSNNNIAYAQSSVVNDYVIATVPVDKSPQGIAVDVSQNRVYVVNDESNDVSIIDGSTNTAIGKMAVGGAPFDAVFDFVNRLLYVTDAAANTVSVVDPNNRNVIATISVGSLPHPITFNSANNRIYVANRGSNDVNVINTATNKVEATIPIHMSPQGIAADPIRNKIYATANGAIDIIDGFTNKMVGSVQDPFSPTGVVVNPRNSFIYVTNTNPSSVAVINPDRFQIITMIPLPLDSIPQAIDFDTLNNNFYVADFGSNDVSVIDSISNTLVNSIQTGLGSFDVEFNPTNGDVYVTNGGSNTVSVISTAVQPLFYTTITSAIDGNDIPLNNGDSTISNKITFTFTSTENIVGFECSIDNSVFSRCSTPTSFSNLNNGNHIFQVRVIDPFVKDSTPAILVWSIITWPQNPYNATGSQAILQSNNCGNGILPLIVTCNNTASQVQGYGNTVNVISSK